MESLKDRYVKLLASKIIVSIDDLTDNESKLIDESFELFKEKLDDIEILKDEIKRISIELANLKAMQDDSDNDYDN
jgi:hypothetical protein